MHKSITLHTHFGKLIVATNMNYDTLRPHEEITPRGFGMGTYVESGDVRRKWVTFPRRIPKMGGGRT